MEVRSALDRLLEYKIDNEVGHSFSLSTNEVTGYLVLQLLNRKGIIIDQVELLGMTGANGRNKSITGAYVDYDEKQLVLVYYDDSKIRCDISGFLDELSDTYSKEETVELLAKKQDVIDESNKLDHTLIEGLDYSDLANTPYIPVKTSDLENDSDFVDESALNAALKSKADQTDLTSHINDLDVHVSTDEKTIWNGKQDKLVDGKTIKTINGEPLLGEGDITVAADTTKLEEAVKELSENKQDALPESYIEYLKQQTFKTPTISVLQILNSSGASVSGTYELGSSVTVSQIRHQETNIDNITGNLTFNGTDSIAPSSASVLVDTTDATVTSNKTFSLTGTDALGENISKSASVSFVRYAYSNVTSATTAPTTGNRETAISTFSSNGASFDYGIGDYIYLYTTNSGKTIQTYVLGQWADVTTESLGTVSFTQNNGTVYNYYVYRTGPFIAAGTATYRV